MPTDFITRQDAKVFLGFPQDDQNDAILDAIIPPICQALRDACGKDFDQRTYSEVRNGNGRPVIYAFNPPVDTATLPTVTENGVALIVGTGYNTAADVIVEPTKGRFYRISGPTSIPSYPYAQATPGAWSRGIQNVALGYKGGYLTATLPAHLLLLTKYMVGEFWTQLDRKEIGIAQRSVGQATVNLLKDLPDRYQRFLDLLSRPMVPEI